MKTAFVNLLNTILSDSVEGVSDYLAATYAGSAPTGTASQLSAGPNNIIQKISLSPDADGVSFFGFDGTSSAVDPLLVGTTPADNGGPTATFALQSTSPAIDVGNDIATGPDLTLPTDQRGFPRKSGPAVDLGAYELSSMQPAPPVVSPTTGDGLPLFLDLNANGVRDAGEPSVAAGPLFPGDLPSANGSLRVNSSVVITPAVANLFAATADGAEGFVRSAYRAVLGREADAAGLAGFVAALRSGVSQADVARALWGSAEHRATQLAGYFRDYLGRDIDAAGLQAGLAAFAAGATEERVVAGLLSSAEARAKYGTDGEFVAALYRVLLGRERADGEAPQWEQVAAVDRAALVGLFLAGEESRLRLVDGLYAGLLNRIG